MGLVSGSAGTGQRHGGDYLPVVWRVFVEVYDREEIRRAASLVAGPYKQMLFRCGGPSIIASSRRMRCRSGGRKRSGQHYTDHQRREFREQIRSVKKANHLILLLV